MNPISFFDKNMKFLSDIFFCEILKYFFPDMKKFLQSGLCDMIRNLLIIASCWNRIMIDMWREGKCMELAYLKIRDDIFCVAIIRVSFSRKSDDKISSDIYFYSIFSI